MICSPPSTGRIVVIMQRRRAAGDLELFLELRIAHEHLEHEAVLLRLGQRIGAFLLDGVLRRQDEERSASGGGRRPTVTWRSCMASSRAACVLGGVRLISSARMTLANIGPCRNRNSRWPVERFSSMTSVPVMSAGIRSGVNWMRLNASDSDVGTAC